MDQTYFVVWIPCKTIHATIGVGIVVCFDPSLHSLLSGTDHFVFRRSAPQGHFMGTPQMSLMCYMPKKHCSIGIICNAYLIKKIDKHSWTYYLNLNSKLSQ